VPAQSSPNALRLFSDAIAALAQALAPAVVQVQGRYRPATGVVFAPERVLTTAHSIDWQNGLAVRTDDGRQLPATCAGDDGAADIAVLKVPGLDAAPLTPAADPPRTGQLAVLAGRSWRGDLRLRLTTPGGISGSVVTITGARLAGLISLPLGVHPGFSGSALVLPDGSFGGLATAGLVRGNALALPAHVAVGIARVLDERGSIRRGFLGVTTQPVRLMPRQRGSLAQQSGLMVMGVAADSPADAAGLLAGDILVAFDGAAVESPEDLLDQLGPDRVDTEAEVQLLRGAALERRRVTVAGRPRRR
jgi:serine protease DegQ